MPIPPGQGIYCSERPMPAERSALLVVVGGAQRRHDPLWRWHSVTSLVWSYGFVRRAAY